MLTSAQIRAARAMINAKQSELAAAAGISLATLNNIERGVADPRASTLDAIERALFAAGIECESEGGSDVVRLSARQRPSGRESLRTSQRILELLDRSSLLKPDQIQFFVHLVPNMAGEVTEPCLGVLVTGAARRVLFDQAALSINGRGGLAEIAGILLAALALYGDRLLFSPNPVTSPHSLPTDHAIARLTAEPTDPLEHPRALFDLLGSWDECVEKAGSRDGHPMRDLLAFIGEEHELTSEPDPSPDDVDPELGAWEQSDEAQAEVDQMSATDDTPPQTAAQETGGGAEENDDAPTPDFEIVMDEEDESPPS